MIIIGINNGRDMQVCQNEKAQSIKVFTGKGSDFDSNFDIPEGDFVMLINYYRHVKDNDVQCDFVNPSGKNQSKE